MPRMMHLSHPSAAAFRLGLVSALCVVLAACGSTRNRAPVEERSTGVRPPAAASTGAVVAAAPAAPAAAPVAPSGASPGRDSAAAKTLPGAENAGKPGYYTVKPGDTLIRVALENGQNWRDIARWSQIDNPNVIEVGQVLRVLPPGVEPGAAVARPVASAGKVESRPLEAGAPTAPTAPAPANPTPAPGAPMASGPAVPGATATPPAGAPATATRADDEPAWGWPAAGPVVANFDESRNVKGLAIGGKAGDPVLAAADGRVVYAGSGLRGYGNLVIVKHNNVFLTAYAHNQTLLVKEDQAVRKGQKIAEMGSTDAERVQLHFEIRRQGRPVDPARMLPPR